MSESSVFRDNKSPGTTQGIWLTLARWSDTFDMVAMETVANQYLGGDSSLSCSPETQTRIDTLTVDLVKTQHQKAIQLLQDNLPKLHEIAKYLYEHETITGEEFMTILMRKPELAAADFASSDN